jgi:carbonic anhydrase
MNTRREFLAVAGALDAVRLGNLTTTLSHIRPAVLQVTNTTGASTSKNKQFVQAVADQNAKDAAATLTTHSEVLAALVASHDLQIASAMHDVSTGVVTWFT